MMPSEYLRECVIYKPEVFFDAKKYHQAKNIVDMYLTDADASRCLIFHDYLMFVLICAEDLADETRP